MSIGSVICSEMFLSTDAPEMKAVAIDCGHVFHITCLTDWFQQSKTCPICRHPTSTLAMMRLHLQSVGDTSTMMRNNQAESNQRKIDEYEEEAIKCKIECKIKCMDYQLQVISSDMKLMEAKLDLTICLTILSQKGRSSNI